MAFLRLLLSTYDFDRKSSSRSEKGAEKEKNNDPASDAEVDLETDAGQVPANISMTAADDDGDDLSDVDMEPDNKDDYSRKQGKKHLDEQEYEDEENLDEDGVAIEEQDTEPGLIEDMLEEDEMKGDKESEGKSRETLILTACLTLSSIFTCFNTLN